MVFTSEGDVLLLESFAGKSRIRKISNSTGILSILFASSESIGNMAIDANDNVYLTLASKILKLNITDGNYTVIIGSSIPGYSGDNSLAKNAKVDSPTGIKVNSKGEIYFSDTNNRVIRKINVNGTVTTVAGNYSSGTEDFTNNSATSVKLPKPYGLAIHPINGDVYFIESKGNLRKFTPGGNMALVAGCNTTDIFSGDGDLAIKSCLNNPVDLEFLSNGELIIAETNRIRKIDLNGIITTIAGNDQLATNIEIKYPFEAEYDESTGLLYILECYVNSRVFVVDQYSNIIERIPTPSPFFSRGLNSTILQTDRYGVYVIDLKGNVLKKIEMSGVSTAQMAPNGDIYVSGSFGIAKVDAITNDTSIIIGKTNNYYGDYGLASKASMNSDSKEFYLDQGNIYFMDYLVSKSGYLIDIGYVIRKIAYECPRYSIVNPANSSDCICNEGYYGEMCEDFDCFQVNKKDNSTCSSNGTCIAPDTCKCFGNINGYDCSGIEGVPSVKCYGIIYNSPNVCSGRGNCTAANKCSCSYPFYGNNCEKSLFPVCYGKLSIDPLVCSKHGECVADNQCNCTSSYDGDECENLLYDCYGISSRAENVCDGHGTCVSTDYCKCKPLWKGDICNMTDSMRCFDYIENDPLVCNEHGICVAPDTCNCTLPYYGNNCQYQAFDCFGVYSTESNVCSQHGYCIANDTCICKTPPNIIYSGLNCENFTCALNYYGNQCEKFCLASSTCSKNGECLNDGSCKCFSNSTNGYWTLGSCSKCQANYYGESCLTRIVPTVRFTETATELQFEMIPPNSFTQMEVVCSSLIDTSLINLGNSPKCKWNSKELGDFRIILGTNHGVKLNSPIKINSNIFNVNYISTSYISTKVLAPLNITKPIANVTYQMEYAPCSDIITIQGSSNSWYTVYKWTIISSPQPLTTQLNSDKLTLTKSPYGLYTVKLVVYDFFATASDPFIFSFNKKRPAPTLRAVQNPMTIYVDQVPIYVTKYLTFTGCYQGETYDKSMVSIVWNQTLGPETEYSQVSSTSDLVISSFTNYYALQYIYEAKMTYYDTVSTLQVVVNTLEEVFDYSIYTTGLTQDQVVINININPPEKIKSIKKYYGWKWNCKNTIDQTPCDSSMINDISSRSNMDPFTLRLTGSQRDIELSLSIGHQIRILPITFPTDNSTLSISLLCGEFLITGNYLYVKFLVTLNGKSEGIYNQIRKKWLIDGIEIPENSVVNTQDRFSILYPVDQLIEGSYHNITLTVSKNIIKASYTYSFQKLIDPEYCFCSGYPNNGTALETLYSISCDYCPVKTYTKPVISFYDNYLSIDVPLLKGNISFYNDLYLPQLLLAESSVSMSVSNTNIVSKKKRVTTFEIPVVIADISPLQIKELENMPISKIKNSTISQIRNFTLVKEKKTLYQTQYNNTDRGDPNKITLSYYIDAIDKIVNNLRLNLKNIVKRSTFDSNCVNGYYNEYGYCLCNEGYRGTTCDLLFSDWVDLSNQRSEVTIPILQDIIERNENEPQSEEKLAAQTSIIYHAFIPYCKVS